MTVYEKLKELVPGMRYTPEDMRCGDPCVEWMFPHIKCDMERFTGSDRCIDCWNQEWKEK